MGGPEQVGGGAGFTHAPLPASAPALMLRTPSCMSDPWCPHPPPPPFVVAYGCTAPAPTPIKCDRMHVMLVDVFVVVPVQYPTRPAHNFPRPPTGRPVLGRYFNASPRVTVSHGDLRPGNMLFAPAVSGGPGAPPRTIFADWEAMSATPVLWDFL